MRRKKVLHAMSGGAPVADAEWFRAIKLTWVLEGSGVPCRKVPRELQPCRRDARKRAEANVEHLSVGLAMPLEKNPNCDV